MLDDKPPLTVEQVEEELVSASNTLGAISDELYAIIEAARERHGDAAAVAVLSNERAQQLITAGFLPLVHGIRALATLRRLERYPDS